MGQVDRLGLGVGHTVAGEQEHSAASVVVGQYTLVLVSPQSGHVGQVDRLGPGVGHTVGQSAADGQVQGICSVVIGQDVVVQGGQLGSGQVTMADG